jgi:HK97 family phage prohead protease
MSEPAVAEQDERALEAEKELRKAYTDAEVEALGKEGKAFKNPDGHYSFPIDTDADLANAIQALGRAPDAVRDAVKAYIKKRAEDLKATDKLPEDWRSEEPETEHRELQDGMEVCPTCGGDGTDDATCDVCEGTGEVAERSTEQTGERRASAMLSGTVERRDFTASDVEIRATSDGGLRFSGYASTTETPYQVGGFEETFARGAFKRCLGEDPDVVLLVNHTGLPLARTRSGTMTLSEDTRGLKVDADLDPTDPDVQALVPKMKRGDLTEMSFAFRATDDEWDARETKRVVRAATIHKADVSMVTHGANTTTSGSVAFRSEEGSFELRIDESRIGKALSNAKKTKLEAIRGEIDQILGTPDEPETPPADPLATIIPSGVEAARAAKARLAQRTA